MDHGIHMVTSGIEENPTMKEDRKDLACPGSAEWSRQCHREEINQARARDSEEGSSAEI